MCYTPADTVKPDLHARRFAAPVVTAGSTDGELVDLVEQAADELGSPARELDWRNWEATRNQ